MRNSLSGLFFCEMEAIWFIMGVSLIAEIV